jgi:3-hydroxyacyl-CoA dehydrogenase-like protein
MTARSASEPRWYALVLPANVMAFVEVARSELVSERAHTDLVAFLISLGKRPVVVRDSPGFFLTRFVNTWVAEVIRLIEEGIAGPAEIDEMVKSELGWPMGVFELVDESGGFDAWYHAQEYLRAKCGERYDIPPLAERARAAGYRGDPRSTRRAGVAGTRSTPRRCLIQTRRAARALRPTREPSPSTSPALGGERGSLSMRSGALGREWLSAIRRDAPQYELGEQQGQARVSWPRRTISAWRRSAATFASHPAPEPGHLVLRGLGDTNTEPALELRAGCCSPSSSLTMLAVCVGPLLDE